MTARQVTLIETDIETRGAGVPGDPVRRVRQFWTLDGELVAEVDPCPPTPPADVLRWADDLADMARHYVGLPLPEGKYWASLEGAIRRYCEARGKP